MYTSKSIHDIVHCTCKQVEYTTLLPININLTSASWYWVVPLLVPYTCKKLLTNQSVVVIVTTNCQPCSIMIFIDCGISIIIFTINFRYFFEPNLYLLEYCVFWKVRGSACDG